MNGNERHPDERPPAAKLSAAELSAADLPTVGTRGSWGPGAGGREQQWERGPGQEPGQGLEQELPFEAESGVGTRAGAAHGAADSAHSAFGTPVGGSGAAAERRLGTPRPHETRPSVRVVRPGGNAARQHGLPPTPPPVPLTPPISLPPWLAPAPPTGPSGAGHATNRAAAVAAVDTGIDINEPLAPEESAVRDLMHQAVAGLQPAPTALERLRHAVPQRQTRRRRAYGSIAAAFALGVIGAAAIHSATTSVETADGAQATGGYQNAGTSSPANSAGGGTGASPPSAPGVRGNPAPSGSSAASLLPGGPGSGVLQASPVVPTSYVGAPWTYLPPSTPAAGGATAMPPPVECGRSQLGGGVGTLGAADASGKAYGSFKVTNTSGSNCEVSTPGVVAVLTTTNADPSRIAVVEHAVGDPANGLPAPAATPAPVVLAPGQSYVVDFAWVPASGTNAPSCPTASASPTTSTAAGTSTSAGTAGGPGTTAPPGSTSPGSASGASVTIGHTPGAGGSVAASVTVPGACAGTVYRTAPLPAG